MARCSKKITGSLPRRLARSRPTASSAFDGTATFQPGECTNCTSLVWLCQGSPHLKKPMGMRTTMGAAKRLLVRQRMVPQSLSCSHGRVGIFAELDFRHRHKAGERHADGAADDAFFRQAGVEHPRLAEFLLQPQRHRMHAAFRPHVLAEDEHARIDVQFVLQRAADRGDHVDALALRLGLFASTAGGR